MDLGGDYQRPKDQHPLGLHSPTALDQEMVSGARIARGLHAGAYDQEIAPVDLHPEAQRVERERGRLLDEADLPGSDLQGTVPLSRDKSVFAVGTNGPVDGVSGQIPVFDRLPLQANETHTGLCGQSGRAGPGNPQWYSAGLSQHEGRFRLFRL